MNYGFGVDLGGTFTKFACFDADGTLVHKWQIPTNTQNYGEQILPDIAHAIHCYMNENNIEKKQVIGVGMGVPGAVGTDQIVDHCANLGWGVVNAADILSDLTGLPVKIGNDATLAALGEAWKGSGANYDNIVLITLGTGVGGGIIINGQPVIGAHGACGEIGHIVLNRNEKEQCSCGKYGCVEQYCSATGIVRTAKKHLAQDPRASVLRNIPVMTCKDIFDAGAAGDALAKDILEEVYDNMAEFIADVCCVLDPSAIVIGGGVSKAGDVLLDGITRHFPKYIFHAISNVHFFLASLGNDAGVYGAFKLILDTYKP